MLRELLSSRLIQGGLVFFLLCVVGSLLYSWQAQRATEPELGGTTPQGVSSIEKRPQTKTAPVVFQNDGLTNTPNETTDTQKHETTEAETRDQTQTLDLVDAFSPEDFVSAEEAPAEDGPVSPFGFGPYPEVPADYPLLPSWKWSSEEKARNSDLLSAELLSRVLIELWNQGENITGGSTNGLLMYPHYPKTVYALYEKKTLPNGTTVQSISKLFGGPDISEQEMRQISRYGEAPGITILDAADTGINPHTFLTLERK